MSKNHSVTVRKVRNRMIAFYTTVMIVLFFAAFSYAFINMRKTANSEMAGGMSALELQYAASLNNFTNAVESDCTAAFRNGAVTGYDPIENDYAEYDNSSLKSEVKSELLDLAAGNMYVDFMIAFSDGSTAGKVSSGTSDLIAAEGFDSLYSDLGGRSDAWLFGLCGKYRRIYYIREITDHSVFLVSMYAEELDKVFALGGSAEDITLFISDGEMVIYSNSEEAEAGGPLPEKYAEVLESDGECVTDSKYVGASLRSECGWRICAVTNAVSLIKISPLTAANAFMLALILAAISLITGILACGRYTATGISDPDSEFTDPLTGSLNEYGLDEKISELMETSIVGSTYAFILLRLKDSRQIKSTVSLRCWNGIKIDMTRAAEKYFSDIKTSIGRVSDDMTVVFADYSEFDIFKAHEKLREGCEGFRRSFESFSIGSGNDMKLHVSIGVCIYPDHAEDFDSLLEKAKEALKKADSKDGDSIEFYDPAEKKEAVR